MPRDPRHPLKLNLKLYLKLRSITGLLLSSVNREDFFRSVAQAARDFHHVQDITLFFRDILYFLNFPSFFQDLEALPSRISSINSILG